MRNYESPQDFIRQGVEVVASVIEDEDTILSTAIELNDGAKSDGECVTLYDMFGEDVEEIYSTPSRISYFKDDARDVSGKFACALSEVEIAKAVDDYCRERVEKESMDIEDAKELASWITSRFISLVRDVDVPTAQDNSVATPSDNINVPEERENVLNTELSENDQLPDYRLSEEQINRFVELDSGAFQSGKLESVKKDTEDQVREYISRNKGKTVDWSKLELLRDIPGRFFGTDIRYFRTKRGGFTDVPPYFIVSFMAYGKPICVAESPIHGNATYIFRDDINVGTWQEMIKEFTKQEARDGGAMRVFHRKESDHKTKVMDVINNLVVICSAA